ncbi:putative exported protein [Streptococcus equi subsp. zooepidemicus]|uniref:Putative exported protein n=2 Tax=Streptococcus equi TaxID=1336 RepID=C0MCR6_STRS7|nr:putative exported protein [Streptococcus equi subsp. zooepidemicus]
MTVKINNRKLWLGLIIAVGAMIMLFSLNGKRTEEQQKRDLETSIAKLLVHDYEDVKEVKFTGWGRSRETGSWGTTVVINGENEIGFSFDGLSGLADISGRSYHPDTFKLVEKNSLEEMGPVKYRIKDIEKVSLERVAVTHSHEKRS